MKYLGAQILKADLEFKVLGPVAPVAGGRTMLALKLGFENACCYLNPGSGPAVGHIVTLLWAWIRSGSHWET